MTVRQANAGREYFQTRYLADGSGGGWRTVRSFTIGDFPQLVAAEHGAIMYTLTGVCPSFSGGIGNIERSIIQYRPAPTLFTFGAPVAVYTVGANYLVRVEPLVGPGVTQINLQVFESPPVAGAVVYLDFEAEIVRGPTP